MPVIEGMKAVLPGKFRYFRFKMQFRKSWLYRILYPLLRNSLRRHLGCNPCRNQVDDSYCGFTLMTGLIRYPLLRLRTWLAGYYLMDRYFYDHLLVNLRFFNRPNRLLKGWSTWLRFIPRPFWLIQLDAPSEVILSRKKQLTPQDIETVRQWMFEFYLQKYHPFE